MLRTIYKSKIHKATVTDANLNYTGSITIDETLMEAADIMPNERVQVLNINNGTRLETYAMRGGRDSGVMCMNGPAAHHAKKGDKILVVSYAIVHNDEAAAFKPTVVFVDGNNKVVEVKKK
ncbi:MAG: aspartate 1-decarboxylase [Candidatus Omnitrophota bacterium]